MKRKVNVVAAHFSDYACHWPSGIDYGPRFDGVDKASVIQFCKTLLPMCHFCRVDGPIDSLFVVRGDYAGDVIIYHSLGEVKAHFGYRGIDGR